MATNNATSMAALFRALETVLGGRASGDREFIDQMGTGANPGEITKPCEVTRDTAGPMVVADRNVYLSVRNKGGYVGAIQRGDEAP